MKDIEYITETGMKSLIESEVETNSSKGFVKNPSGFAQHLIQTGKIAHQTASIILRKHPSLRGRLDPRITKIAGWVHDFTKIHEGSEYHEVGSAHIVLTEGDGRLELITGGTKKEKTRKLIQIARCLPPDFALYEELGGASFPNKALYQAALHPFLKRIEELRTKLSTSRKKLSIEEFALPFSLEQQVLLYADMVNNGEEGKTSIERRLTEIKRRYGDPKSEYHNPILAGLIDVIAPRILVVGRTIENLM